MGRHSRRGSETDLTWPFGNLQGIDGEDLRETAYEIFFTACRSSPGFGGRNALTYYPCSNDNNNDSSNDSPTAAAAASSTAAGRGIGAGTLQSGGLGSGNNGIGGARVNNGVGMAVTSRVKRSLGLKTMKRSPSRRTVVCQSMSLVPTSPNAQVTVNTGLGFTVPAMNRARRPLTSAEIMRQQMRVTEHSDNRLRKTLMRTLVGQMGRRAETIILPLELLRHLKPSEFNNSQEYHVWQKRQLKLLELGLLVHPSIPIEKSNTYALRLKEIIQAVESKPIDTGKNSEAMRTLCNCVVSLSWRSVDGTTPTDVCHWADGFPININVYIALLNSIFDIKDETLVLDEVDELLELMKKTWSTLGISRSIHNLCFTWVLFQQHVATSSQTESDLLGASLAMLAEVSNDAKKSDKEDVYVKILSTVLSSMKEWPEKRLLNYHEYFNKENVGLMENFLPLAQSASEILEDCSSKGGLIDEENIDVTVDSTRIRVDNYIRSSIRNAFAKIDEETNLNNANVKLEASEALINLAKDVKELVIKEKENFSPILKKWHPIATGVAAVTLHSCYGTMLKQYLSGVSTLTNKTIEILQKAGELEKYLVQMVAEDSVDCDDGGKAIVREMVPYEVESIILNLLKKWIEERLIKGRECIDRAKESETWNPKSKTSPYAHSAMELVKLTKDTIDDFFEIQISMYDYLVQDLVDGLEHLFREYTNFAASCGSKQGYIPNLPPLTRCSRDSKFIKLWKQASQCNVVVEGVNHHGLVESNENNHPRPSTSRGTQRLYIRLNTLNYLLEHINSLDKTICLSPCIVPSNQPRFRKQLGGSSSYFDIVRTSIQTAILHVSEVAAYRLIFLDSNSVFYDGLYIGDLVNARIRPALRLLKQNLTLLSAILMDRAQPLAIKQVMKASFEAYLMVLLAGGYSRSFSKSAHGLVEEDFESLKRAFSTCGEGLMNEEVVEKEAEIVEGVVALMGQSTEQLVEDFSIVTCKTSGVGVLGVGQTLPMPSTTGRWNRADPNTILRVLCHRNDRVANHFLKRTFQLPRR